MKKTTQFLITAAILAGATSSPLLAKNSPQAKDTAANKTAQSSKNAIKNLNKKAVHKKEKSQNDLLKTTNKDVVEGLKKVVAATKLIEEKKDKEAIKMLQEATGKFDIALAANPKLGLIPIQTQVIVHELITTSSEVIKEVEHAKKLLKESKVQEARAILLPLRDELVTTTSYLPMQTYPLSIKLAAKLLINGNRGEALATLSTALSTVVDEVSIMPLSLVRAESLIQMASKMDKDKEKDDALAFIQAAQDQLKTSVALGYNSKNNAAYQSLNKQIEALRKEINSTNKPESFYKKLLKSIRDMIK